MTTYRNAKNVGSGESLLYRQALPEPCQQQGCRFETLGPSPHDDSYVLLHHTPQGVQSLPVPAVLVADVAYDLWGSLKPDIERFHAETQNESTDAIPPARGGETPGG